MRVVDSSKKMFHGNITIVVLSVVLCVSIAVNIMQIVAKSNLENTLDYDRVALQNYRDLQERQIKYASNACHAARTSYDDKASTINLMRTLIGRYDAYPELMERYVKDEALAQCYSSVFVLQGKPNIYLIDQDRMSAVSSSPYVLKEDVFDEVKW